MVTTTTQKHIIGSNAAPYIHERWTLVINRELGEIEWNPKKLKLITPDPTLDYYRGEEFWEGGSALNGSVLDHLLRNPSLIPEEWKEFKIFFCGTIFTAEGDRHSMCVRYLYWIGDGWSWGCEYLSAASKRGSDSAIVIYLMAQDNK